MYERLTDEICKGQHGQAEVKWKVLVIGSDHKLQVMFVYLGYFNSCSQRASLKHHFTKFIHIRIFFIRNKEFGPVLKGFQRLGFLTGFLQTQ